MKGNRKRVNLTDKMNATHPKIIVIITIIIVFINLILCVLQISLNLKLIV